VLLSSERSPEADSYLEETSSNEEEDDSSSSSLSSLLSSLNALRFFDITVEFFTSSSAYMCLFSEEVIGVAAEWNLFSYKCQHSGLYGIARDPSDDTCTTI
jgi:hypothetical protein